MLQAGREAVAAAARGLAADGLVRGTSGNVSLRDGDAVAITPTGARLADLEADAIAVVDLEGKQLWGELAPTSEIDLHLAVYATHGAGAVVHTHAPNATAVACVLEELPVVHYEMLLLGGAVRVAPYETFGTPELAAAAVDALEGRNAALLANHGTIASGADLDFAVRATELLEWSAQLYLRAASLGEPRVLNEAQQQATIAAAVARSYGAPQAAAGAEATEA